MKIMYNETPESKDDQNIQLAYEFLLNFMEATANETQSMVLKNQLLLKKIIEAAKISEKSIDQLFQIESSKAKTPSLLPYSHS